jgi:hypothetical protein
MVLYFGPAAPIFLVENKTKRRLADSVSKAEAEAASHQIEAIGLLRCSSTDESFQRAMEKLVWYGYYHNLAKRR